MSCQEPTTEVVGVLGSWTLPRTNCTHRTKVGWVQSRGSRSLKKTHNHNNRPRRKSTRTLYDTWCNWLQSRNPRRRHPHQFLHINPINKKYIKFNPLVITRKRGYSPNPKCVSQARAEAYRSRAHSSFQRKFWINRSLKIFKKIFSENINNTLFFTKHSWIKFPKYISI